MIKVGSNDGREFNAYLALPPGGRGPGLVLIQEIFGVNATMRETADRYASHGLVVLCPDLFWRQQPAVQLSEKSDEDWPRVMKLYEGLDEASAVDDVAATLSVLRGHEACTGKVGALGFCLGGKLAYLLATRHAPDCAVGYYGVGIENALDEAEKIDQPLMLHIAGKDQFCPASAQQKIHAALDAAPNVILHDYPNQEHAFARAGGAHNDPDFAELANLRTLEFLRRHLAIGSDVSTAAGPDFAALWEEHVKYEFETRDHVDTLDTMVDDAYVNHIPTLTGGVGKEQLEAFYSKRFIPQMPPDTTMTPVSRTIGTDRLVDEMIFKFTHSIKMDWMLPGLKPTGKPVEIALVAIVHFRNGKLAHEHIYWDQASVLVQLGLLDAENLPVAGVETARKVLDNAIPSNALIERADRRMP